MRCAQLMPGVRTSRGQLGLPPRVAGSLEQERGRNAAYFSGGVSTWAGMDRGGCLTACACAAASALAGLTVVG